MKTWKVSLTMAEKHFEATVPAHSFMSAIDTARQFYSGMPRQVLEHESGVSHVVEVVGCERIGGAE